MSFIKLIHPFAAVLLGLVCSGPASALAPVQPCPAPTCYDLTTAGAQATINGATFRIPGSITSGTGLIDSFVRIQATGSERGYNTSDRPVQFDETADPFTHDLLLSAIPSVTISGTEYLEFVLDTNEPGSDPGRYLSLEELRFYSGANQATHTVAGQYNDTTNQLGSLTAVYDMDAGTNTFIQLDSSLFSGSGQLDMILLVPKNLFTLVNNDPAQTHVYLYSKFGRAAPLQTQSGFEEWAHKVSGTFTNPAPGALALLLVGGFALMFATRVRGRRLLR